MSLPQDSYGQIVLLALIGTITHPQSAVSLRNHSLHLAGYGASTVGGYNLLSSLAEGSWEWPLLHSNSYFPYPQPTW